MEMWIDAQFRDIFQCALPRGAAHFLEKSVKHRLLSHHHHHHHHMMSVTDGNPYKQYTGLQRGCKYKAKCVLVTMVTKNSFSSDHYCNRDFIFLNCG